MTVLIKPTDDQLNAVFAKVGAHLEVVGGHVSSVEWIAGEPKPILTAIPNYIEEMGRQRVVEQLRSRGVDIQE